jgi:hypothetical protein
MKTLKQFSDTRRVIMLVISALLISLCGCSRQDTDTTESGSGSGDMNIKSLVMHEGTANLHGLMRWYVYAKMEHKLVVDPELMFTLCEAELTFLDGQNFALHTRETIPMDPPVLYREMTATGTITPGGAVKFTWPETWMELNWETGQLEPTPFADLVTQVGVHTGYELTGPGVNKGTVTYTGFFDGGRFYADCHVNAFQLVPGPAGTPYAELIEGPLIFSMITDLQVVD